MANQRRDTPIIRQIDFGRIDFGHFDIGEIRGAGRPHFDIATIGNRPFGSYGDDPWHEDRQFIDRNHGDGHNDRHNDQHVDDPDYPDDSNHTDRWHTDDPHDDTAHADSPHDDAHDDSDFGGISRKQFQDALGRIQNVINQLIRQQQQTIDVTERHLADMSRKLNAAFDQIHKNLADLEARTRGSRSPDADDPDRPR